MFKKILFIILLKLLLSMNANSQIFEFVKDKHVNLGVGLSSWSFPIYSGIELFLNKNFSLGLEATYATNTLNIFNFNKNNSILGFNSFTNYYLNSLFDVELRFDIYTGVNMGYYFLSKYNNFPNSVQRGFNFGAHLGAKYNLNQKFAINLELNVSNKIRGTRAGISIKI